MVLTRTIFFGILLARNALSSPPIMAPINHATRVCKGISAKYILRKPMLQAIFMPPDKKMSEAEIIDHFL